QLKGVHCGGLVEQASPEAAAAASTTLLTLPRRRLRSTSNSASREVPALDVQPQPVLARTHSPLRQLPPGHPAPSGSGSKSHCRSPHRTTLRQVGGPPQSGTTPMHEPPWHVSAWVQASWSSHRVPS